MSIEIFKVETIDAIRAAIWERQFAPGSFADAMSSPLVPTPVGVNVQPAAFWATMQGQVADLYNGGTYFRPSFDPDSFPLPGPNIGVNVGVVFTEIDCFWISVSEGFTAAGLPGWMRKRPRVITSLDATHDDQGNIAAIGQRARFVSGGVPGTPAPTDTAYHFNGSSWVTDGVRTTAVEPDVVYTDRANFRTINVGERTEAHDASGNVATSGQRAVLVGTGSGGEISDRLVYRYDGSLWSIADPADGDVDTLVGEVGDERTISSTGATADQQGNPASEGMVARGLGDGQVYQYQYDEGTDAYVWATPDDEHLGVMPDRLLTGSGVFCGPMQPGDYFGDWIVTDLRTMLVTLGNRTLSSSSIVPVAGEAAQGTSDQLNGDSLIPRGSSTADIAEGRAQDHASTFSSAGMTVLYRISNDGDWVNDTYRTGWHAYFATSSGGVALRVDSPRSGTYSVYASNLVTDVAVNFSTGSVVYNNNAVSLTTLASSAQPSGAFTSSAVYTAPGGGGYPGGSPNVTATSGYTITPLFIVVAWAFEQDFGG